MMMEFSTIISTNNCLCNQLDENASHSLAQARVCAQVCGIWKNLNKWARLSVRIQTHSCISLLSFIQLFVFYSRTLTYLPTVCSLTDVYEGWC
jgi:hypothetical protein